MISIIGGANVLFLKLYGVILLELLRSAQEAASVAGEHVPSRHARSGGAPLCAFLSGGKYDASSIRLSWRWIGRTGPEEARFRKGEAGGQILGRVDRLLHFAVNAGIPGPRGRCCGGIVHPSLAAARGAFSRLAAVELAQNAAFLILPALAVVSVIWSQYPEATLRLSIQFLLTSMIGIWAGTLIHPAAFASALLCALTAIVTGGIAVDGGAAFRGEQALQGFFGSKNMFALFSVIQLLAGITVLFDRRQYLLVRALGLFALFEAPVCLVAAQSTGALVFSIPAIAAFLATAAIARLSQAGRRLILAAAIIAGAAAIILVMSFGADIGVLLDFAGKKLDVDGAHISLAARARFHRSGAAPGHGLWRLLANRQSTGRRAMGRLLRRIGRGLQLP